MISLEFNRILIKRQMEQMYGDLGIITENEPGSREVFYQKKGVVSKLSEWFGVTLIDAGEKLLQYAHKDEVFAT